MSECALQWLSFLRSNWDTLRGTRRMIRPKKKKKKRQLGARAQHDSPEINLPRKYQTAARCCRWLFPCSAITLWKQKKLLLHTFNRVFKKLNGERIVKSMVFIISHQPISAPSRWVRPLKKRISLIVRGRTNRGSKVLFLHTRGTVLSIVEF